jgi:hypothetical protein
MIVITGLSAANREAGKARIPALRTPAEARKRRRE